jgi:hypothetical protein
MDFMCDLLDAHGVPRDVIQDHVAGPLNAVYDRGIEMWSDDPYDPDFVDGVWEVYEIGVAIGFRRPLRVVPCMERTWTHRERRGSWEEIWDAEDTERILEGFPVHRLLLDFTRVFVPTRCWERARPTKRRRCDP